MYGATRRPRIDLNIGNLYITLASVEMAQSGGLVDFVSNG